MWQVFGMLYDMFQKDGADYFQGMLNFYCHHSLELQKAGQNLDLDQAFAKKVE